MKKLIAILMFALPLGLAAQVLSTGKPVSSLTVKTDATQTGSMFSFTGVAQPAGINLATLLTQYTDNEEYNYFEVNEDMFKAFTELENADSASIELFRKIKSVKMLERKLSPEEIEQRDNDESESGTVDASFYNDITGQLDISGYTQLLKSRNGHSLTLFLKKDNDKGDREFLLITNKMLIDITGNLVVKTIYQMEEMLGMVQQILPN